MKAETKAKRRSTLDLLGLGVLDETEVHSIIESGQDAQVVSVSNKIIDNSVNRIISQIAKCNTVEELTKVYNDNKQLVHDAGIIDKFATRKSEING
jgi:hypothetical protein